MRGRAQSECRVQDLRERVGIAASREVVGTVPLDLDTFPRAAGCRPPGGSVVADGHVDVAIPVECLQPRFGSETDDLVHTVLAQGH